MHRFKKTLLGLMVSAIGLFGVAGFQSNASGFVTTNVWQTGYMNNPGELGITGMHRDDFEPGEYNIYITVDTQRHTETYYQTRGFTMQRCVPTLEPTDYPQRDEEHPQYITIKANQKRSNANWGLDGTEEGGDDGCYYEVWKVGPNGEALAGKPDPGDKIYTVWYISANLVEKKIKEVSDLDDPESWYNTIKNVGGFHYLKVDSLMTYYNNGHREGDLVIYPDGYKATGKLYSIPSEITGLGVLNYHSMPFGFGSKLESHYNKYIEMTYNEPPEDDDDPHENVDTPESSYKDDFVRQFNTYSGIPVSGAYNAGEGQAPYFKTYNESRAYTDTLGKQHTNYDISKESGIPTKEKIVNGIDVDGFYGYVNIGKHTVGNKKWGAGGEETFTVPYQYTKRVKRKNRQPGQSAYTTVTVTGTWTGNVVREASYYYIWSMDLYDFEKGTTESDTFPGKRTSYSGASPHQKADGSMTAARPYYEAIIGGTQCGTAQGKITLSSWKPDNDEHIEWKKVPSMTRSTIHGSSRSDCVSKAKAWAEGEVGDNDYAKITNDKLQIGNFIVMDNTEVKAKKNGNYLIEPKWMTDFERETRSFSDYCKNAGRQY